MFMDEINRKNAIKLAGEGVAKQVFIDRFLVQVIQIFLTEFAKKNGPVGVSLLLEAWQGNLQMLRGELLHAAPPGLSEQDTALCNQAVQEAISALSADFLSKFARGADVPPQA